LSEPGGIDVGAVISVANPVKMFPMGRAWAVGVVAAATPEVIIVANVRHTEQINIPMVERHRVLPR
jgi:hypothetical protein